MKPWLATCAGLSVLGLSACGLLTVTPGPEVAEECGIRQGVQTAEEQQLPPCDGELLTHTPVPTVRQFNELIGVAQDGGLTIDPDHFGGLVMNVCASLLGDASAADIAVEIPAWYPARFGHFSAGTDIEFIERIRSQAWCRLN